MLSHFACSFVSAGSRCLENWKKDTAFESSVRPREQFDLALLYHLAASRGWLLKDVSSDISKSFERGHYRNDGFLPSFLCANLLISFRLHERTMSHCRFFTSVGSSA